MAFKLPNLPTINANISELADFAECLCFFKGQISQRNISAILGRLDDNLNNDGCDDDDDMRLARLDEVMNEIEYRARACSAGYPFLLNDQGTSISLTQEKNNRSLIYLYLLLSTRLDMKNNRCHANIDGTFVLESLSAQILKNYLGGVRAKSLVFGTSEHGCFKDKINNLCLALGEGGTYKNRTPEIQADKDGKLDSACWIPFSDALQGKLIIFGQCKTGTSWKQDITQLQPHNFVAKWCNDQFAVAPIRAFFISEAPDRANWYNLCIDAGLLFDRCRIIDFCDYIPEDLIEEVKCWTKSAQEFAKKLSAW